MLPSKIRGFRSRVINALIDCIRAQRPVAGKGVVLQRTPTGTIISSTATGGGGITITPAAELLRPLTIRKFELEQATSSGTSTLTKWGCYIPDETTCALVDFNPNRTLLLSTGGFQAVDESHPLWRDITEVMRGGGASVALYAEIVEQPDGTCALSFSTLPKGSGNAVALNGAEDGSSKNGWRIYLGYFTEEDGGIRFWQSYYGPISEETMVQRFLLMERASDADSSTLANWSIVPNESELSATKVYAYLPHFYGRVCLFDALGTVAYKSGFNRHKDTWIEGSGIPVKPLVYSSFSGILS